MNREEAQRRKFRPSFHLMARGRDEWRALALRVARHPGTQRVSKEF